MRLLAVIAVAFAVTTALEFRPALPGAPAIVAAQTARPAAGDADVPFRVGETLTYDVSWSRFLVAGTAVTKVLERKPSFGSTAWAVMAEGRPISLIERLYPVYYKMDALVDTRSLLSQWTGLFMNENGRRRQTAMTFNRATRRAVYEMPSDPSVQKEEITIPNGVQDGLTTLFALRARTPRAGEKFTIPVADDGSLYTAEITSQAPERVTVPFATADAWNMRIRIVNAEQQEVGKNIGVWISTDARRLPLRIEAELPVGTFGLMLRDAQ